MHFPAAIKILATGTSTSQVVDPSAWQPIIDAFNAQVSVSSVIGVLGAVIGVSIGFVFMWWGVRKTKSVLMAAFQKGKLKL